MTEPVTFDQNPTISDTVAFEILTPDANDCFLANPYAITQVKIYSIQRDFNNPNITQLDVVHEDATLQATAETAKQLACTNPTPENILAAQVAQQQAAQSGVDITVYYNEAASVLVLGTDTSPAWLSTNPSNSQITLLPTDPLGNPQFGHFQFIWQPLGQREGDYVICWTWSPHIAGGTLSDHRTFSLIGDTQLTTSIPTHYTDPKKYEILLDRYLPTTYKRRLVSTDLTPQVLNLFHKAVANGFTDLENLVNQLPDLLDANAVAEALLPNLGNLFNLRFRSDDPTRWRRQIKQAIPLYKAKGTLPALEEALDQAGVQLNSLTHLWQVVSSYTWVDAFTITDPTQTEFTLSHAAQPVDLNNFNLSIRRDETTTYTQLSSTLVSFSSSSSCPGGTIMTWLGAEQVTPVLLNAGDVLKVMYLYNNIPGPAQSLENFIRTLPIMDQRDETLQTYPPKNWNTRMIAENDPMFSVVIPSILPFQDPVVFGKVRTEMVYSEKAYNSDEYNSSIRDSTEPCDIDKYFTDTCSFCPSSDFNIDVTVEALSDDSITEVSEIVQEFTPFHGVLFNMSVSGSQMDFVEPPIEQIFALVDNQGQEFVLTEGQFIFNRARFYGLTFQKIYRNALATGTQAVAPGATATAYNNNIALYCGTVDFSALGINPSEAILEVLSPSPNQGTYDVGFPNYHSLQITSNNVPEPLNKGAFTFRLSHLRISTSTANIDQSNIYKLTDTAVQFSTYPFVTQWDQIQNPFALPWTVSIPTYSSTPYPVYNIAPDGGVILSDPSETLPTGGASNLHYTLLNGTGMQVVSGTTGIINVTNQALVHISGSPLSGLAGFVEAGFYARYLGVDYQITGLAASDPFGFYIEGYSLGDASGVSINIYQRLLDDEVGVFGYQGFKLLTTLNLEVFLNIQNGDNPPAVPLENNRFKENYLIQIDETQEVYAISEINGTTVTLSGVPFDVTTLSAGGTPVTYSVTWYQKIPIDVDGSDFDFLDRRGKVLIEETINNDPPILFLMSLFNQMRDSDETEVIQQQEKVSYKIEYQDGRVEKGDA